MNVIIIAALALIVLIVLVFIFSDRIQVFGQGAKSCGSLGGECSSGQYATDCLAGRTCRCPDSGDVYISGTDCEDKSQICCKPILRNPQS